MKKVYLDNAATTPLRPEVIKAMTDVLNEDFGNPSSTHSFGRSAKNNIEISRKTIAKLLGCTASEIMFTSCATEATNFILHNAVKSLAIQHIITSKIEHHATLYTVQNLQKTYNISVSYVKILPNGNIDLQDFERLVNEATTQTLVTFMHVNNETGVVLNIEDIGSICRKNHLLFHCDMVQSVGKINIDLAQLPVDFAVAGAHKFHGPKGVGFAYIKKNIPMQPLLTGGEQEKGLRAGTEATHQIVGMAKALELSYLHLEEEKQHITAIKEYCIARLKTIFTDVKQNAESSFYTILNVTLPIDEAKAAMLLFNLDIKGIAVSRGSACQSGSAKPSHVLAEYLPNSELKKPSLRLSFSHYNTFEDIDYFIEAVQSI